MAFPVAAGNLVGNEAVARRRVRDAQQGFGKTHQRHTLFAGECELVHQRIHTARLTPVLAHLRHQTAGKRLRLAPLIFAQLRLRQHIGDGFRLITAVSGGNRIAQGGLWTGKCKHDENSLIILKKKNGTTNCPVKYTTIKPLCRACWRDNRGWPAQSVQPHPQPVC